MTHTAEPETKTVHVDKIRLVGTDWPNVQIMRSAYYADPSVAALVANTQEGEPLAAFSVFLMNNPPAEGCIWIKTWGEGEGAAEELVRLGLVELTGESAPAGYSIAVEARLIGDLA